MTLVQATRRYPEVLGTVLVAAALAWWWTIERMAGMDAGPGADLGTLGWFTGTWLLMMAAMMLPSFAPTLAAYATLQRGAAASRCLLFAGAYLLAWAATGVLAYGVFELGRSLFAGALAWHNAGRWLSGAVLAAAAAYEFVPLKRRCLARCRGQLGDLHGGARPGAAGALAMGLRSGGWCIGCSWALMAALFALGAMSLTWMVLIAGLVALEKTSPWPSAARFATAGVLTLLAVGMFAIPNEIPGLAVHGSGGMHAMKSMS